VCSVIMIKTLIKEIEARNKLLRTLLDPDINGDFYNSILNTILEVSHSKFGFIGYIDDTTGDLICPTMTHEIWNECQIPNKDIRFAYETWENSDAAWAQCLKTGQIIVKNNADHKVPEGHLSLERSVSIPLKISTEGRLITIGMIGLANKETDYTSDDVQFLEKLADTLGPMVDLKRQHPELISEINGVTDMEYSRG